MRHHFSRKRDFDFGVARFSEGAEKSAKTKSCSVLHDGRCRGVSKLFALLKGIFDLTGETPATWLVLSLAEMADALRNTSDFAWIEGLPVLDPFAAPG